MGVEGGGEEEAKNTARRSVNLFRVNSDGLCVLATVLSSGPVCVCVCVGCGWVYPSCIPAVYPCYSVSVVWTSSAHIPHRVSARSTCANEERQKNSRALARCRNKAAELSDYPLHLPLPPLSPLSKI